MTKKEKVWSYVVAVATILSIFAYFGLQPYWTKIDPEALAQQLAELLPDQL